jgi:cupin fold WbuC family metalloprotein
MSQAIEGKIWGQTQIVHQGDNFSIHLLNIRKGGYCSEHFHKSKWNIFLIISGKLEIDIWREKGQIDKTILQAKETSEIPPGVWHKFTALENTIAIEIYRVTLDPGDIERRTQGGRK